MKERKPDVDRKEDTKGLPKKEQVAISRLRTGYMRATHGPKMEGVGNPLCPFCNTDLSVDHILWECKETEDQRTNMHMNNEQWINGIKSMEKMIDYAKEIGLYNGIQERGKKTTIARRKRIKRCPWNINLRKKKCYRNEM
jgi:hypothetical protein